jgi:hypothetical protein
MAVSCSGGVAFVITSGGVGGRGGSAVGVLLLLLLSVAENAAVPLTLLLLMLLLDVWAVTSFKLSFLGVGNFKVPTGTLLAAAAEAAALGTEGGEKFSKDEFAVLLMLLLMLFEWFWLVKVDGMVGATAAAAAAADSLDALALLLSVVDRMASKLKNAEGA